MRDKVSITAYNGMLDKNEHLTFAVWVEFFPYSALECLNISKVSRKISCYLTFCTKDKKTLAAYRKGLAFYNTSG